MIVSTTTRSGKPIEDVSKWSTDEQVQVECPECKQTRWLSYAVATANIRRTGDTRCKSCALTGIPKPHLLGKPVCVATGDEHPSWKGGSYISHGYRHIYQGHRKYKKEHTLVMEEVLGRPLTREELVHHIDGDRLNNSPENLVVMEKTAHHKIAHHSLQKIGYDLVRAGLVTFDRGTQEYVAHLKLRELLGHLEAGNQQPSRDSDDSEGSETRDETLVVNKFPTSAGHPIG